MLLCYYSNSGVFEFVERSTPSWSEEPTFTIVVGKNGTGKSRMLSAVTQNLLHSFQETHSFRIDRRLQRHGKVRFDRALQRHGEVKYTGSPTRIICVSTSPFDRFPLPRKNDYAAYYSYLGLRGLPSQNLGAAYLGRVMATLFSAIEETPEQAAALARVLHYLNYEPFLEATFELLPSSLLDALNSADPVDALEEYGRRPMSPVRDNILLLRQLFELPPREWRHLIETALKVRQARKRRIRIAITPNGLDYDQEHGDLGLDFVKMARYGLIRLREARFFKDHESVSMNELSSGEQSVMMGLLGIGSQICDGALICIDEPEVCLHPEWQARYIQMLYQTFEVYRGCHFIIATHSPQIVAHLPPGNCHVTPMETGIAEQIASYAGRSADFQLARLFRAPGHRNEYLNRIAVNLFTRVTQKRMLDSDAKIELKMLEEAMIYADDKDPLHELLSALKAMREMYA